MNSSSSDERKSRRQQVAVALKDDQNSDAPQKITATGRGAVAEQIIQIALDNGIRVREDPDLAEILTVLDVESTVPVEVLATISEILSYVYKTNAAMLPRKEFNDGPAPSQPGN
jgi:flagellar biosynthesis protein